MMAHMVVELEDPIGVLENSLYFVLTVILGLFTHVCIVLPLIFLVITRRNPLKYMAGCFKALLTAFVTNNR